MKHASTHSGFNNEDWNNLAKIALLQLISVAVLVGIRLI